MSEDMKLLIWIVVIIVDVYMYLDWGYNTNHRKESKYDRRKRNQRNHS